MNMKKKHVQIIIMLYCLSWLLPPSPSIRAAPEQRRPLQRRRALRHLLATGPPGGRRQPRLRRNRRRVRAKLRRARLAGRRLVITGGASQLQGVSELATLILEKQVRIGRPLRVSGLAEATSGAAFATCAGLLRFAVENRGELDETPRIPPEAQGIRCGRLGQRLRENL